LGLGFRDALEFYSYGDVVIRFGHRDYGKYPNYKGGVKPLCGEMRISVDNLNRAGAREVYKSYFNLIKLMWHSPHVRKFAVRYYLVNNVTKEPSQQHPACHNNLRPAIGPGGQGGFDWGAKCDEEPDTGYVQEIINSRESLIQAQMTSARQNYIESGAFDVNEAVTERGWGGAAIWFNDIAAANGSFFSAVYNIPNVDSYPFIMQKVAEQRQKTTNSDLEAFKPNFGEGSGAFSPDRGVDEDLAEAGHALLKYFDSGQIDTGASQPTGNVFHDLVNMMLGTQGLFSIRDNRDIHPLAQMTALGRSMLDTSIRNFAIGAGVATFSRPRPSGQPDAYEQTSTSLVGMAFMGITLGFILHYILPFLPFIYFFFAVSNWVKEVFEAMIGMPLWAIAHLQLEGKGLPGSAAGEGYFLLLGIFLRPVLILFGLIAAIAVFSAQAVILHDIFDLVVANLTGHGGDSGGGNNAIIQGMEFARSSLDEFFYTVLYVIILYLMATASFKLIDAIPEQILRWAGSDAKPFSDDQEDPTNNLVRNVAIGSRMALQQPLTQATVEFGQTGGAAAMGVSKGAGSLLNSLRGAGTTLGSFGRGLGR
jgi:hypothetical protein